MVKLFDIWQGLIPACDMSDVADLAQLVAATASLPFVVGYKIGMVLGLSEGLGRVMGIIREHTELPVIYDHQKFGTDVPELCSGEVIGVLRRAGVQAVIVFPHAGVRTLEATVKALQDATLVPIVGGEMTHPGYLQSEGGYIADGGPAKMYGDAAALGVEHFVIPGTRPESMARYKRQLVDVVGEPKFLFPGIGRGQGGDIVDAFRHASPLPSYAIVGRGISAASDRAEAARSLWQTVEGAGLI